jgi:competence protein ComEC
MPLPRLASAYAALQRGLRAAAAAQAQRWILWLPIAAAIGAALWLAAPADPASWIGPSAALIGAGAAIAAAAWPSAQRGGPWALARRAVASVCALACAAGLGASAAALRTASVAAPRIAAEIGPVGVEGWVVAAEPSATRQRIRLMVTRIEGMARPPRFVRISMGGIAPTPGRGVRCFAILRPLQGPLAPGSYDFARRAYFEKLGGSGFALGRCRPIAMASPASALDRARLALAAMRADLTAIIYAASPGPGGALAAALVTGDRSLVDTATNDALRDSGLGHLISVSGLHMSIVGGILYVGLIGVLALIAPIALRVPVRKIAAVGALSSLTVYLLVSGASVPAIRAYVMACVAFGAILLDRPAISMRGLGLALLIIVLWMPESVLEPGFQMSFAATAALIAAFEIGEGVRTQAALPAPGPFIGALQTLQGAIAGALAISLVAGLATEPFALYHFQRLAAYGLPVNLAAAPIVSFLIAPAAVAALLLAPFGWGDEALALMAWGCDLVIGVSAAFAERPEAVRALPRPPDAAFLLCVAAILWGAVWRGALRWGACAPLAAAAWLYATAPQPTLAFDAALRALYVYTPETPHEPWRLLRGPGRSPYARERLGETLGVSPRRSDRLAPPEGCDEARCVITHLAQPVMVVRTAEAFAAPCVAGAWLLTPLATPPDYATRCAPAMVIDAHALAAQGGGFVRSTDGALRITRAYAPTARRPWSAHAPPADDAASRPE